MPNKLATPDTGLGSFSILNDRPTWANDPRSIDKQLERLGTGGRRMAIPMTLGRPREKTYDASIWQMTFVVPPYTKGIGVRGRALIEVDADSPDAQGLLYYRFSGDSWNRYLVFDQATCGDPEANYDWETVIYKDWVMTIPNANPDSTDILSSPLPVTADDEPQSVTVEFKMECDLDFYLFEYGLFYIPYDMEPFPDLP